MQRLLDEAHQRARTILTESWAQLDQVAQELLRVETIYAAGLAHILGPQPAAPDLTPKEFSPDGKVPDEVPSGT